jgi:hypothetical protein
LALTPDAFVPLAALTFALASLRCIVASFPVNRKDCFARSTAIGASGLASAFAGSASLGAKSAGRNALTMYSRANSWYRASPRPASCSNQSNPRSDGENFRTSDSSLSANVESDSLNASSRAQVRPLAFRSFTHDDSSHVPWNARVLR